MPLKAGRSETARKRPVLPSIREKGEVATSLALNTTVTFSKKRRSLFELCKVRRPALSLESERIEKAFRPPYLFVSSYDFHYGAAPSHTPLILYWLATAASRAFFLLQSLAYSQKSFETATSSSRIFEYGRQMTSMLRVEQRSRRRSRAPVAWEERGA